MKQIAIALLAAATTLAAAQTTPAPTPAQPQLPGLTLSSASFADGAIIPNKYTAAAEGAPTSPELSWSYVPDGTVSFVLLVQDPDVVVSHGMEQFPHWVFFNIPATVKQIAEGLPQQQQLPDGSIQLLNRRKSFGWLPPGASSAGPYHHYTFSIFALDTKLTLGAEATQADVLAAMQGHILGRGVLVGRFHKP